VQFTPSTCRENDRTLSKRPITGPAKDVFALKINELLPILQVGWLAEYGIGNNNNNNNNNNIVVLKIEKNAHSHVTIIMYVVSISINRKIYYVKKK